jgi:uncharacterized protein
MKKVLLAIALTFTSAAVALAQVPAPPQPPVLAVTGNAVIMATPDEASARLGIIRQAPTAQSAQNQASAVAQQILNEITKVGIKPQQIQTSRLVLSPIYDSRNPERKIVGYNASNTVTVRVEDLTLVGPVIDAGLKAGANHLEGVQFGLRNELPSRQQALKQAVNEARSKAQAMAEALGVNLGEVLEVSESGSLTPKFDVLQSRSFEAGAIAPTPVSPGEIQVDASVMIRYRISQKP